MPTDQASDWSARQYRKFEDERTRPARDLLAAVPRVKVRRAVDLGCGPGNSTALLAAAFPEADILGVDSSPDMIAAARERLPRCRFVLTDLATWNAPGPWDLVLANAALQWVPDHASLLPRLVALLAEGGSLAVQMPDNLDEPTHRLMREVAAEPPWAEKLAEAASARMKPGSAGWYYRLLAPLGGRVQVWRTTYYHPLAERAAFLARYRDAVAEAYPPLADGTVLLPYPRLFFVATR
jgi:trans-aconitate 2-methyltransferase